MSPPVVKKKPAGAKQKNKAPTEELPMEQEPVVATSTPVVVPNRFAEVLADIRAKNQITLDNGESVQFDEELKEEFLEDVERSFPVVQKMVANLYETGMFFKEVRDRQKKKKLWIAFTETIGVSRRTIHTYIQVVERLGEDVNNFSYLGVTKLMTVSRLKQPVPYLEAHASDVAATSVKELIRLVVEEIEKTKKFKKKGKKKAKKQPERIATARRGVKLIPSSNGKELTVVGLTKGVQRDLMEAIKEYFSQGK